jgi:hypothetical protein
MGQAQPEPFYCPRCGGLMQKLTGSSFYWHAENNHPPCLITNLADPKAVETQAADPKTIRVKAESDLPARGRTARS